MPDAPADLAAQLYTYRARDFVRNLLPLGKRLLIETIKDEQGKYGRYLAEFHLDDGTLLNDLLVERGYAQYATYA